MVAKFLKQASDKFLGCRLYLVDHKFRLSWTNVLLHKDESVWLEALPTSVEQGHCIICVSKSLSWWRYVTDYKQQNRAVLAHRTLR